MLIVTEASCIPYNLILQFPKKMIMTSQITNLESVLKFCQQERETQFSNKKLKEFFLVIARQLTHIKKENSERMGHLRMKQVSETSGVFNVPICHNQNNSDLSLENVNAKISFIQQKNHELEKRLLKVESLIKKEQQLKDSLSKEENRYPKNFIITDTPYFPLFEVLNTKIRYIGQDMPTMILGKHNVADIGSFKIRISECNLSNIKIGICDSRYAPLRDCDKQDNAISMLGWKGEISSMFNYQSWKGTVFDQVGQTIQVKVDLKAARITWIVDSIKETTVEWEPLHDVTIKWLPMVRLLDKGTAIEWLEG